MHGRVSSPTILAIRSRTEASTIAPARRHNGMTGTPGRPANPLHSRRSPGPRAGSESLMAIPMTGPSSRGTIRGAEAGDGCYLGMSRRGRWPRWRLGGRTIAWPGRRGRLTGRRSRPRSPRSSDATARIAPSAGRTGASEPDRASRGRRTSRPRPTRRDRPARRAQARSPATEVPAAPRPPIARALRMIDECQARYEAVRDYVCTFSKRERINGRLTPPHVMS